MSFFDVSGALGTFRIPKSNAIATGAYATSVNANAFNGNAGSTYITNDGSVSVIAPGAENGTVFTAVGAPNGTGAFLGQTLAYSQNNARPYATFRFPAASNDPAQVLFEVGNAQFTNSGLVAQEVALDGLSVNDFITVTSGITTVMHIDGSSFEVGVPFSFGGVVTSSLVMQGDSDGNNTFTIIRGVGASAGKNAFEVNTGASTIVMGTADDDVALTAYAQVTFQSPAANDAFLIMDGNDDDVVRVDTFNSQITLTAATISVNNTSMELRGAVSTNKFVIYDVVSGLDEPRLVNVDTTGKVFDLGNTTALGNMDFRVYGVDADNPLISIVQFGVTVSNVPANRTIDVTNIVPIASNVYVCGTPRRPFNTVYSVNGVNVSDRRVKKDIVSIDPQAALTAIKSLKPSTFKWTSGSTWLNAGLVAQELLESDLAHVVDTTDPDHLGVRYNDLIAYLIAAIQALSA